MVRQNLFTQPPSNIHLFTWTNSMSGLEHYHEVTEPERLGSLDLFWGVHSVFLFSCFLSYKGGVGLAHNSRQHTKKETEDIIYEEWLRYERISSTSPLDLLLRIDIPNQISLISMTYTFLTNFCAENALLYEDVIAVLLDRFGIPQPLSCMQLLFCSPGASKARCILLSHDSCRA